MGFRLVTFDSTGKIVAIDKTNYSDNELPQLSQILLNPQMFGFVSTDQLPTGNDLIKLESGSNPSDELEFDGGSARFVNKASSIYYDPRSEVMLEMENPAPYIGFGTGVKQDITKTTVVYNTVDSSTKPIHSESVKKFGTGSGKFTRSVSGFTGGSIYVTNIVKRNALTLSAPHNRLGFGNATTPTAYSSYGFELFFYPTSLANSFTLLQKGLSGASANWKLAYNSTNTNLEFVWQGNGTTAGYNYDENIVGSAGISLNNWNHVAVSLIREGTSGVTYTIKGYFNSINTFSVTGTANSIPENNDLGGIYIGNNHIGTESFNGYIDSLRVFDTDVTGGLLTSYGFYGNTLQVPTSNGFTTSSEICFVMNFNGQNGSDAFYAESTDRVVGIVTKMTNLAFGASGAPSTTLVADVGVRDVYRYQYGISGPTGLSDGVGFSLGYGPIVNPYVNFSGATGITHGTDYVYNLYSVADMGLTFSTFQNNYRYNSIFETMFENFFFIEGASGNRGSCGNATRSSLGTNPFGRLFGSCGGNYYGISFNHSALFIDPINAEVLSYIMRNGELAGLGICRSSYFFTDAMGYGRTLNAQQIYNLRLDLLDYFNRGLQSNLDIKTTINSATSNEGVRIGKATKTTGSPYIELSGEEGLG